MHHGDVKEGMMEMYGYDDQKRYYEPDYSDMSTADYMKAMAQRAHGNVEGEEQPYYGHGSFRQQAGSAPGQGAFLPLQSPGRKRAYADELREEIPDPKKERKEKREQRAKKEHKSPSGFFKRAAAVLMAAVLFGGVAGGMFYGIAGKRIKELDERQKTLTQAQPVTTAYAVNDGTTDSQSLDVSDIAASAMPSVVAITIKAIKEYPTYFGYYQEYETEGSGSGIIIGQTEEELLLVTNNHVVEGATKVSVAFIDQEICEASVKGTDKENDLAVIAVKLSEIPKVTLSEIKIARLGNSEELKVGQQVVAIGNALGYGQSVTTGIVSALNRYNRTNATPLIQVDAAINPGNSGGALLNMNGEVIGINSSKYASTDVEGVGYAIPITRAQEIIAELMHMPEHTPDPTNESEDRGYLGVKCSTVTEEASAAYGIPVGVIISGVTADSGAKEAGLAKNDVITSLDGIPMKTAEELTGYLESKKPGDKVEVTYEALSEDHYETRTVTVTLIEKPEEYN